MAISDGTKKSFGKKKIGKAKKSFNKHSPRDRKSVV